MTAFPSGDQHRSALAILQQHVNNCAKVRVQLIETRPLRAGTCPPGYISDIRPCLLIAFDHGCVRRIVDSCGDLCNLSELQRCHKSNKRVLQPQRRINGCNDQTLTPLRPRVTTGAPSDARTSRRRWGPDGGQTPSTGTPTGDILPTPRLKFRSRSHHEEVHNAGRSLGCRQHFRHVAGHGDGATSLSRRVSLQVADGSCSKTSGTPAIRFDLRMASKIWSIWKGLDLQRRRCRPAK